MAISVRVSDYDLSRGVPQYNLSSRPNPSVSGGISNWHTGVANTPATADFSVVEAADLEAQTGVVPRRAGNRYSVATFTSADVADGFVSQSPDDMFRIQANTTLTFTQWFYVASSASAVAWSGGAAFYNAQYVLVGSQGDSYLGTIPTNEWVRLSYPVSFGGDLDNRMYAGIAINIRTGALSVGDRVIVTDAMASTIPDAEYFDGEFESTDTIKYEWSGSPWLSQSTRTVRRPSTVRVFPPDNIIDYSVVEEAMSPNPADFSGGYGSISFSIVENPDTKLLRGKTFELEDGIKGKTSGIVTHVSSSPDSVSVTTDSMLGVLNSWQTLDPISGTFSFLIRYVFDLVSLNLPVRFEGGTDEIPVISRGYIGNLWDWIKQLLSANQVEMALVYNTVVFRPYRTYEAYRGREEDFGWSVSQTETARAVEVTYYNSVDGFMEYYPVSYDDDDDPVIMQADAGETVEYALQLSATPVAPLQQPIAVYTVDDEPQPVSVYSVAGNDDLPIQPAQWRASGGDLTVRVSDEDPSQVIVTVRGANIPNLAPFRIAMSSGSGNYYNSLHLVGEAIKYEPKVIRIPTGASIDTTGTDVGVTVENPFIQTKEQAFSLGILVAGAYSGGEVTVSGSAWDINRREFSGGVYAQIRDFNSTWESGSTIADFNARYALTQIVEFNERWDDYALGEFPVQAFGNAAGARLRDNDAFYRITSATFTPGPLTYMAVMDSLVGDFNDVWDNGTTIAEFNEELFGKLIRDFSTVPLRRDNGE